jgi:hypothetical protein
MSSLGRDDAFAYQSHDPGSPPRRRDVVISIIAVIHVVAGCWRLYQENHIFLTYLDMTAIDDPNVRLWGPPIPLVMLANLTVLFILAAGLGLWLNAKWGWWLTGFVYCYVVVQAVYLIVMWQVRKDYLLHQGIAFDFQRYFVNLVIYSLLLWYLRSKRVLKSLDLPRSPRFIWTSIAAQFGAASAGVTITTLLSIFIVATFGQSVPYIE